MPRLSDIFDRIIRPRLITGTEQIARPLAGHMEGAAHGARAVVSHDTATDQDLAKGIRLTGTSLDGTRTPVTFHSSQAKHHPLVDGDGTVFGTRLSDLPAGDGFPSDAEAINSWASGDRHSDRELFPRYVPPNDGHGHQQVFGPPEKAAWADAVAESGQPPAVAFAHGVGEGDGFLVDVNTGTVEQPEWTSLVLDGESHGRLLESIDYFARAAQQAPATLLVSCKTAMPGASAAREAADYLHSSGTVRRDIHAPTDLVAPVGREPGKTTDLGVIANYDSNGNPLPLFATFPAPENRPTPWLGDAQ
ncbi:hypothetical protein [Nocardia testacea]|uniref:hypothetical protein n=1 Tax=Nocardia testacea TaxID=248551 RepID=UPI003A84B444